LKAETLISIVTHNDAATLRLCLESLARLETPARVKVWDNASADGSAGIAQGLEVPVTACPDNLGYCGGHNRNIQGEEFDFVLFMNADVILAPDFLARLLPVFEHSPETGMAVGKLLRMDELGCPVLENGFPVLDSTGIVFHRNQRHLDRGSGEPDTGRYDRREAVFGGTGAALLCSRRLVEDLKIRGEFWDEDFFAFREDADLAWRARLLGWQAVYEPSARALHRRHVRPENRGELPSLINMHSVKNRFLMRRKNMDRDLWKHCFPSLVFRDLGIICYILLKERTSLEAFRLLWRMRGRTKAKRREIQARRKVSGGEISPWFL